MTTIDFSHIFRICNDGIYYDGGFFSFKDLVAGENGFFGEETYENGEFKIVFYSADYQIKFPLSAFSKSENPLKEARAKSGSCSLHLSANGILIKEFQN